MNSFSYVFHHNGFCIDCGARLLYLAHIGLVPQVRLPSSLLPQYALLSLLPHFTLPIAILCIGQSIATVRIAQSQPHSTLPIATLHIAQSIATVYIAQSITTQ